MNLMNLKGRLHASVKSGLVFSSALNNTIDKTGTKKYIHNTTIKYTIDTIQETNIQHNNLTHVTTKLMTIQQ